MDDLSLSRETYIRLLASAYHSTGNALVGIDFFSLRNPESQKVGYRTGDGSVSRRSGNLASRTFSTRSIECAHGLNANLAKISTWLEDS